MNVKTFFYSTFPAFLIGWKGVIISRKLFTPYGCLAALAAAKEYLIAAVGGKSGN